MEQTTREQEEERARRSGYFNPEAIEFPPGTRVLVAEDDPTTRMMLCMTLTSWGLVPSEAENGAQALDILKGDDPPRLAILDWMMPELDGIDVCQNLRALSKEPYVYIILLTSLGRKEDLLTGLQSGADDYLVKPFDLNELRVRLKAGERIIKLQSELMEAKERLHREATHDHLTGLLNRRALMSALDKQLARTQRTKEPISVIISDIDHFKSINDTYGHDAGDAALIEVARRLQEATREYDTVGRQGGEEFMVILPDSGREAGVQAAERLRQAVRTELINVAPETDLRITMSFGVFSSHEADREELIRAADKALYRAKHGGRDRVEFALPEDVEL